MSTIKGSYRGFEYQVAYGAGGWSARATNKGVSAEDEGMFSSSLGVPPPDVAILAVQQWIDVEFEAMETGQSRYGKLFT